jgi:hypothetical protein
MLKEFMLRQFMLKYFMLEHSMLKHSMLEQSVLQHSVLRHSILKRSDTAVEGHIVYVAYVYVRLSPLGHSRINNRCKQPTNCQHNHACMECTCS